MRQLIDATSRLMNINNILAARMDRELRSAAVCMVAILSSLGIGTTTRHE
jgi:hypothetical protein